MLFYYPKQIAGKDVELSPTCIGSLWIFQNLASEDVEALAKKAEKIILEDRRLILPALNLA